MILQVENLARIKTEIAKRAQLVVVSKTYGEALITPILEAGHLVYGENRVQEAQEKWPDLRKKYQNIELHLIGPLQSNKVAEAVSLFDVIQTVDRIKIASALAQEMKKQGRYLPCYIQVNIGQEPQKSGVEVGHLTDFLKQCRGDFGLNIIGLMCIPPAEQVARLYFKNLAQLAAVENLTGLSMGMSGDYDIALQEGATCVRVGSAIFGARPQITK